MTDGEHIRQTLGRLEKCTSRIEEDISEIKADNKSRTAYETETRRRVDRNTTFARAIAWAGGVALTAVMAVFGWYKP